MEKILNMMNSGTNELFITKKVWLQFTEEEMNDYVEKVFIHYRANGFPYYNLSEEKIVKEFKRLKDFDTNTLILENNALKQVMHGLNLANNFMPHMYHVKCNSFKSPFESFCDDNMLRKAIRKRIKLDDNMGDMGMRKTFSWVSGTQKVSNFRPTIAKYIYDNYSNDGNVLDFSAGYGGRLLGAISSNKVITYTGVEPCLKTIGGLNKMKSYSDKNISLINLPFEDVELSEKSFDLSFSSPPYFNTEEYDYEDTQSFIRYKTREEWKELFLEKIIYNSYKFIKDNGYFIINIANVKTYKTLESDTLDLAEKIGFKLIKKYNMTLSSLMKTGFKYEPIFVFTK